MIYVNTKVYSLPEHELYAERLTDHINNVREACMSLNVDWIQAENHDKSKWGPSEFPQYAAQFCGPALTDEAEKTKRATRFAEAWLHHIHHNPHHWEHWLFSDGFTPKGSTVEHGAVRMPVPYIREMVADWMGASKTYTGTWDMTDWLNKNLPRIRLHSYVSEELVYVLRGIGYEYKHNLQTNYHNVTLVGSNR